MFHPSPKAVESASYIISKPLVCGPQSLSPWLGPPGPQLTASPGMDSSELGPALTASLSNPFPTLSFCVLPPLKILQRLPVLTAELTVCVLGPTRRDREFNTNAPSSGSNRAGLGQQEPQELFRTRAMSVCPSVLYSYLCF